MTTTTLDFSRPHTLGKKKTDSSPHLWKQLLVAILGLTAFGAMEVFSAGRFQGVLLQHNPYYFGILHLAWVGFALVVGTIISFIPSGIWKKLTAVGFLALVGMLVAVFFFPGLNGAHRWIDVGPLTFQPSEAAKLVCILFGAYIFSNIDWNKDKTYVDHLLHFGLSVSPVIVVMLLILFQPDLGNIVVIGVSFFTMYLLSNSKWKRTDIIALVITGILVAFVAVALQPYRLDRIRTYVDFIQTGKVQDEFGTGRQLSVILTSVGSGGLWGKGIGQSRLAQGYLVEVTAFTDSISAVIFEELGFFLSVVFVGVFVYIFLLMTAVAEKQEHQYQRLVMWGLAMWFMTQSLFHFAANVALVPVKGITLPFVSYGGSSFLMFAFLAGMTIHLARKTSETA